MVAEPIALLEAKTLIEDILIITQHHQEGSSVWLSIPGPHPNREILFGPFIDNAEGAARKGESPLSGLPS